MKLLLIILLIISLILESSITTIPLILLILLVSTVVSRDDIVFLLAFIFGILLDILTFKAVGVSSVFFTFLVFLILIYEKKFEINTPSFTVFSTLLSSILFLIFFQRGNVIIQSLISTVISLILFATFKKLNYKRQEND